MEKKESSTSITVSPILNIAVGIILAVISFWLIFVIIPNNISQVSNENDISPSLFPNLSAWFLLGFSLILITLNGLKLRSIDIKNLDRNIIPIVFEAIICLIIATIVYLFLPLVGFLIVSGGLIILVAFATGYRNYWMIGALALFMPLVTSQVVWQVFQVNLP